MSEGLIGQASISTATSPDSMFPTGKSLSSLQPEGEVTEQLVIGDHASSPHDVFRLSERVVHERVRRRQTRSRLFSATPSSRCVPRCSQQEGRSHGAHRPPSPKMYIVLAYTRAHASITLRGRVYQAHYTRRSPLSHSDILGFCGGRRVFDREEEEERCRKLQRTWCSGSREW